MNSGKDFEAALKEALGDQETKMVHFHGPLMISINTPDRRACSAPCREGRAKPSASKLKDKGDGGGSGSAGDGSGANADRAAKAKAKRNRKKARDAELRATTEDHGKPAGKKALALIQRR